MNLHIFGPGFSTFVRSVRLYCEEKGLAYTYGMSLRGQPIEWHGETHRIYHPFGKVPVLFHGGGHVFETNAICRYLDAAFPERAHMPADLAVRTEIDQWSNALATSVDERLVRNYLLVVAGPNPPKTLDPEMLARAESQVEATLAILDAQLGERAFICGDRYSIADALLTPMLDYLSDISRPASWLERWPRLRNYLDCMQSRPSGRAVLLTADFQAG
jgi:glutathione S-transferase